MNSNLNNGKSGADAPDFPAFQLKCGDVTATVCRPVADGYYRATRFDHAGLVYSLDYAGHHYVGPWQPDHDPLRHDGLRGPADEFTPIGYDDVAVGGEFLKIGVGMLRRFSDGEYDRFKLFEITDAGQRELTTGSDYATFRHVMKHGQYGYDYRKTLRLTEAPGLTIEYELTNTGDVDLEGSVYNHNFYTLDGVHTGPDRAIWLPFEPTGTWREDYDSVRLLSAGIEFMRDLRQGESVFMGDMLPVGDERPIGFTVLNQKTGAGVKCIGSGRLDHIVFWGNPAVACVEPYMAFNIKPGETLRWQLAYTLLK